MWKYEISTNYLVRISGDHFEDAKIYHKKEVLEHQKQIHKRYEKYINKTPLNKLASRWELTVLTSDSHIQNWSTSYLHGFNDIYDAKMYILEKRKEHREKNAQTIKKINRSFELQHKYLKISGYYKILKSIKQLKQKYPEKQL